MGAGAGGEGGCHKGRGALPGKHASWRAEVTGMRKKPLGTFPIEKIKKEKQFLFFFHGCLPSQSLFPFLMPSKKKKKKKDTHVLVPVH